MSGLPARPALGRRIASKPAPGRSFRESSPRRRQAGLTIVSIGTSTTRRRAWTKNSSSATRTTRPTNKPRPTSVRSTTSRRAEVASRATAGGGGAENSMPTDYPLMGKARSARTAARSTPCISSSGEESVRIECRCGSLQRRQRRSRATSLPPARRRRLLARREESRRRNVQARASRPNDYRCASSRFKSIWIGASGSLQN